MNMMLFLWFYSDYKACIGTKGQKNRKHVHTIDPTRLSCFAVLAWGGTGSSELRALCVKLWPYSFSMYAHG